LASPSATLAPPPPSVTASAPPLGPDSIDFGDIDDAGLPRAWAGGPRLTRRDGGPIDAGGGLLGAPKDGGAKATVDAGGSAVPAKVFPDDPKPPDPEQKPGE
jgi:hypothetical protein